MKQKMESSCETLKFYSPLVIRQQPLDEYGEPTNGDYEPIDPNFNLLSCTGYIRLALKYAQYHHHPYRGLMDQFHGSNSIKEKASKLIFDIEEKFGTLWGVTKVSLRESLTEEETAELIEYATGQMRDGLGETFEQSEVFTPEGEIYVSMWNPDNFQMIPESEFEPEQFQDYDYSGGMKFC